MTVTSHRVQTTDLAVHYLASGHDGDGEPVVLLHGFPQTSYMWRHQLPAIAAAGHPALAPDSRGFGGTDKPRIRVSRSLLGDDVIRFLDSLEIESAILVGHDWGGIIAFKAAIDHPDRFSRLAMVDTLCTVWAPYGAHGYWFKVDQLAEDFFASHATDLIEVMFDDKDPAVLPGRPASPWPLGPVPSGPRLRPSWLDDDAVAHYVDAFRDPDVHAATIQYYRYALPFHRVVADPTTTHGERYESLSERQVAEMWLHQDGFEQHPDFNEHFDFGPEDRHKRFTAPTLWMYQSSFGPVDAAAAGSDIPSGNPFSDQFTRYFPDLRARPVAAGHFIPEEEPEYTNEVLLDFIAGRI